MKRFFSNFRWVGTYKSSFLKHDLVAGFTVGVLLIPQGMAYALLAGLPPQYGLYTALVPQLVYFFLGTSSKLAVGPVAMDSLLVASSLSVLHVSSTTDYIAHTILLSFLVGCIQIFLGVVRFGFIVNFLSKPVISGFTSAVALLILWSQTKSFVLDNFVVNYTEAFIVLVSIVILLLIKKYVPKLPSSLVLVVIALLVSYTIRKEQIEVSLVGSIPSGFPSFYVPNITIEAIKLLTIPAVVIALIGYVEAMSINKALEENQLQEDTHANQELIAIGFSNVLGSFFQSYPATGGFSRTAVNVQTGAKSKLGILVSFTVVAIVLLYLTPIFYYLPTSVLASIIILSVLKLIDFSFPKQLWLKNKQELLLLIFTFSITLLVGVKEGVFLGVLASLLLMIYRVSNPHIAVLGNVKGTEYYRNVNRFDEVEQREDLLILRFDAQLYFGNKDFFKRQFLKLIRDKQQIKGVVLNAEAINSIDSSANAMLVKEFRRLKDRGLKIFIAGAIGPSRDVLFSNGVSEVLGEDSFFVKTHEAVCFFDYKCTPSKIQKKVSCQSGV